MIMMNGFIFYKTLHCFKKFKKKSVSTLKHDPRLGSEGDLEPHSNTSLNQVINRVGLEPWGDVVTQNDCQKQNNNNKCQSQF